MPDPGRGMSTRMENVWKVVYKKEEDMKLRWFQRNQQKLIADCQTKNLRKSISPEILEEVDKMRMERMRNIQRSFKKKGPAVTFPDIDPFCIKNVMKPVDPSYYKLLYTTMGKEGRRNYLKERYKILPEDRYYFPECTSFVYGWHMFENMRRPNDDPRYGRQQVIKHSFYRRNGGLRRDVEFNRAPQVLSPMTCGQI